MGSSNDKFPTPPIDFFSLKANLIDETPFSFESYKSAGYSAFLVVNVASLCGLTSG